MRSIGIVLTILLIHLQCIIISVSSILVDEDQILLSPSSLQLYLINPTNEEIIINNEKQYFFHTSIGIIFKNPRVMKSFDNICHDCTLCFGTARCKYLYDDDSDDKFSAYKPIKRLNVPIFDFQNNNNNNNVVNITLRNGWKVLTSIEYNFSFKYYKDKDIVIDTDFNDHSILLNDDTMVDVETRSLKNIPTPPTILSSTQILSSLSSIVPGLKLSFEYPPNGVVVRTPKMIVSMH